MKKKFSSLLPQLLFLYTLAAVSFKAMAADCTVAYQKVNTVISSLKIDPTVPVGSVLHSQLVNTRTYPASYNCGTQALYYASEMGSTFSTQSAISGVYETGLTGIGIRVKDVVFRDQWAPYSQSPAPGTWNGGTANNTVTIELIKTGEISSANKGKFKTGTLMTAKVNSRTTSVGASKIYEIVITSVPNGGWTIKSCTIDNAKRDQIIPMGSLSKSDFDSSGYGPVKTFKITINCPDGIPVDSPIRISYDRMTSGNTDGFMDIDSTVADAAAYVGVEVRDAKNSLLQFAHDYTYTSANVINDQIIIPMTARYKASTTVGNINPGTANTAMTITINQD
ncbi:fimbrial protein [Leclercia adecarboxylata]|uniref:fimbrial protein n=1 Tax=Leclercia adecarboxylata TaxID=83655 RepID=UPI0009E54B1D|nr:fimbrial protein [Leclercia adecarboxylata]